MAASHCRASILRDAVLRTAPQDEGLYFFTRPFAGDDMEVMQLFPDAS
jgi:hypothetical protein